MKLTELNPRWTGYGQGEHTIVNGITFDCPHCRTQRLGVNFHPPIDPKNWIGRGTTWAHAALEWKREGDTFDNLTLSPSIDANSRIDFHNHWHGFIDKGEIK